MATSHECILILWFLWCIIHSPAAGAETRRVTFPKYDHPLHEGQKCYKCPPGYYLLDHCNSTTDGSASWPHCKMCRKSRYSSKWNTDRQCRVKVQCEKSYTVVYNGRHVGPIKCACKDTMIDVGGKCIEAVTFDALNNNYSATLAHARMMYEHGCNIKLQRVTADADTADSSTHMNGVVVGMGFTIALETMTLLGCMYKICTDSKKMKQLRMNSHHTKDKLELQSSTNESKTSNFNVSEVDRSESEEHNGIPSTFGRSDRLSSEIDFVDEACRILERKIMANDVDRFVRQVLHFHSEECDKVAENRDKGVQIRTAINIWKTGKGAPKDVKQNRDLKVLIRVLHDNGRKDLAGAIAKELLSKQALHATNLDTDQDQFDEACRICEEKITNLRDDVLAFARRSLSLDDEFVSSVKRNINVVRMCLSQWKRANGENADVKQLVQLLRSMGRSPFTEVADKISSEVLQLALDHEANEGTALLGRDTEHKNDSEFGAKQDGICLKRNQPHSARKALRHVDEGNISSVIQERAHKYVAGPEIYSGAIRESQQPQSQGSMPLDRSTRSGPRRNVEMSSTQNTRYYEEPAAKKNMAGPEVKPGAIRETQQPHSEESPQLDRRTKARRNADGVTAEKGRSYEERTESKNMAGLKIHPGVQRPQSHGSPSLDRKIGENGATWAAGRQHESAGSANTETISWWESIRSTLSDGIRTLPVNIGRLVGIAQSAPAAQNFATMPREHAPLSEFRQHNPRQGDQSNQTSYLRR